MTKSSNPLNPIVPAAPVADRRPTLVRGTVRDRENLFRGWGPRI